MGWDVGGLIKQVGDTVGDTVRRVQDEAGHAGRNVQRAIHRVQDEVDHAVHDAGRNVQRAANEIKRAFDGAVQEVIQAPEGRPANARPANARPAKAQDRRLDHVDATTASGSIPLGSASASTAIGGVETSVRLQANVVLDGGRAETKSITAIGPRQTRDGRLVSERSKSYVLTDPAGKPITDVAEARDRARELLDNGAITTRTPDQAKFVAEREAARTEQIRSLAGALPAQTSLKSQLVAPRRTPDEPNLLLEGQTAPGVSRGEWVSLRQGESTDGSAKLNVMNVPNLVFELGIKRTVKDAVAVKITPQPLTFFVPVTSGLPGFKASFESSALYRGADHPAGFYPADAFHRMNPSRLDATAGDFPHQKMLTQFSILEERTNKTTNFQQFYINASHMFDPATYSINYRAVKHRDEKVVSLASQTSVDGQGFTSSGFVGAPYSWLQGPQAKASLGRTGPSVQLGHQAEVGVYLWNASYSVDQLIGKAPRSPFDWHIVQGKVEEGRAAWEQQFAYVEKDTGIKFRAQSLLPSLGDNAAPVFVQIPAADRSPDLKMNRVAAPGPLDAAAELLGRDTAPRAVSAEDLSRTLAALARRRPEFPELRYITPEALLEANKGRTTAFTDPTTGERTQGFTVGQWVDTATSVSVGGKGLHIDPKLAPRRTGGDGR